MCRKVGPLLTPHLINQTAAKISSSHQLFLMDLCPHPHPHPPLSLTHTLCDFLEDKIDCVSNLDVACCSMLEVVIFLPIPFFDAFPVYLLPSHSSSQRKQIIVVIIIVIMRRVFFNAMSRTPYPRHCITKLVDLHQYNMQ